MRHCFAARWSCAAVLVACAFAPARAADPITMFVLKMVGEAAISAAVDAEAARQRALPPKPTMQGYPSGAERRVAPAGSEEERLRAVIEETYTHLAPAERAQVFESIRRIVDDPANAGVRQQVLQEFIARSEQYRYAQRQLAVLSPAERDIVTREASLTFARLLPEQQQEILNALAAGIPGLPRDLGDQMLANFRILHARGPAPAIRERPRPAPPREAEVPMPGLGR
jgi:hypothetical protein